MKIQGMCFYIKPLFLSSIFKLVIQMYKENRWEPFWLAVFIVSYHTFYDIQLLVATT